MQMKGCKDLINMIKFILKITEFVVCVVECIIFCAGYSYTYGHGTENLIVIAACTYIIIIGIFILAYIFKNTHDFLEVCFLIVGGVLSCIAGLLTLFAYNGCDHGCGGTIFLGILLLGNGVVFLVDFALQVHKMRTGRDLIK